MKKILLILTSLSASLALQAGALSPCQTNSKNSNQGLGANIQTIIQSCGCSGSTCDLSNINTAQMQTILNSPSCTSINLTGANLTNAYLEGLTNATKLILTDANLSGACLSGIDFSTVQFNGGALTGADLSGAILHSANLDSVTLGGTYTTNQNGQTLTFKTNLNNTSLTNATLTNIASAEITASYSASTPKTTPLTIASTLNWQTANFTGANLNGADLRNLASSNSTIITGTNLTNADLSGTIFTGLDSSKIAMNFSSANLQNVQFNGSVGTGGVLSGPDLSGVSFVNANLTGATFNNLNMTNANLTSTNFTNAVFNNVVFISLGTSGLANINLSNANFMQATFNNVIFMPEVNGVITWPNTQLSNNLGGINFTKATFNNTQGLISLLASYNGSNTINLSNAQLGILNYNAGPAVVIDLTHCNFNGATFGRFLSSGPITSTIGGSYSSGTDLRPIMFPVINSATFNNIQFSNFNSDFSSTGSTFNNCIFSSNAVVIAGGIVNALGSKFTINQGTNNVYNNCQFLGILFNNSTNPYLPSVKGMQGAVFNGSLTINACYFQETSFTGMNFPAANFSAFNISYTRFVSAYNSSKLAPDSFLQVIYDGSAAENADQINFAYVQWTNIDPANPNKHYGSTCPYKFSEADIRLNKTYPGANC